MAFLPVVLHGQMLERVDFESIIEELLPQQEYDINYNDLYDRLFSIYSSPIDLNEATREDFQSLFFLTEIQISNIIEYKEKYGKFITFYELLSIDDFDEEMVRRMQLFFKIDHEKRMNLLKAFKEPTIHEVILRYQSVLEKKVGYASADTLDNGSIPTRYSGDPSRIFTRYHYAKTGYYSIGFTAEKDPGEKITWDPETRRYGMDYYSFHFMLENIGPVKRLIVGDFSMDFGQGLVFASGIRFGKGTEPITTIRRNNLGLRPYRSAYESKDYSGVAVTSDFNNVSLTAFISRVMRDARLRSFQNDSLEIIQYTSTINEVGLHRTPSEIQTKNKLSDQAAGVNINIHMLNKRLNAGLNAVFNSFSVPLFPDKRTYRIFQFNGRENLNSGIYLNYYFKGGHAFSEMAMSQSGGVAYAAGIILNPASMIQTSLHMRNYAPNYHSFNGQAFGENITIGNEKGIYWGIRINPVPKLTITSYVDYFRFPWLRYRTDAPSHGLDFMLSAQYHITDHSRLSIRYREKETKFNHHIAGAPITSIYPKSISRFLLEFENQIDDNWKIKSSVHASSSSFGTDTGKGFLIAQDVLYSRSRWSLALRFSIFDVDNYDSRIFIYERDMLYVFAIPSFYRSGLRYYINARYDLNSSISIWLKIAQSRYTGIESIGSSLERINGNKISNIGLQMKFRI